MTLKPPELRGFHGIIRTAPKSACNTQQGLTRYIDSTDKGATAMVPKVCTIDGCEAKLLAKGLCQLHYHRKRNTGSTEVRRKPSPEQRFWSKVQKTRTCWLWTGKRHEYGHPQFKVNGEPVMVYRYSWELHRGPIPNGKVLDHLCRVPWCVNPEHLEPVANGTNVLRGIGPGAINKRKTHCTKGHVLVPRPSKPEYRFCPECKADYQRKRRAELKKDGS